MLLGAAALTLLLSTALMALAGAVQNPNENEKSQTEGKQTFISRCAMCHGLDGRGGEHAPSIATGPAAQLSDPDLEHILRDGIPSRGMPSFKDLGSGGIRAIAAYVRVLQGRDGALSVKGDPSRGRAVFFGAAHCSDCHSIEGQGGFLGPDLSGYARNRSPQRIKQAIVDPHRNVDAKSDTVTAITRNGDKLVGIAKNEDNFSLQLQTLDGKFQFLMKSDLATLSHDHRSLMPSDFEARLSGRDLDDLISFLVASAAKSGGDNSAAPDDSDSQ